MKFGLGSAVAILLACSSGQAWSQDAQSSVSSGVTAPVQAGSAVLSPTPCACVVVPALLIVDIEIGAPLNSATSKDGDTFPIRLSSPITVDGHVAVPAGVSGLGEVVHAQKSGMGGGGGELLLAARYLEVDGRRLRLRSFRAARYGKNQTGLAMATTYAFGVFGLAVKGKNTAVTTGTVAEAKVAEAFSIPLSVLPRTDAPPQAVPMASTPVAVPAQHNNQTVSSQEGNI